MREIKGEANKSFHIIIIIIIIIHISTIFELKSRVAFNLDSIGHLEFPDEYATHTWQDNPFSHQFIHSSIHPFIYIYIHTHTHESVSCQSNNNNNT